MDILGIQASETLRPASGQLVLAIERNEDDLLLVATALDLFGYRCLPVLGGRTALELARDRRPAVITVELSLRDCDGFQWVRALKADPAIADIPVVALTVLASESYRQQALVAGCHAYLTKPYLLDDLKSCLALYAKERSPVPPAFL